MYHRGFTTFTLSMASGESLTSALDLGGPWEKVYVRLPSLSTNAATELYAGSDSSTYTRVMHQPINSSTVATNSYQIASGVTGWVQIPADFPHIKLHTTASIDNGATYTIICK